MKTIKKVSIAPVYVELMPEWGEMKQGIIYISKVYGTACHLCLCGCGERVAMPLNSEEDKTFGWDFTEKEGKITFRPSIGNYNFPCKSHYIITNNIANFV
jgi:hypothetical protein